MSKIIIFIVICLIIIKVIKMKGTETFLRESEWYKKLKDGFGEIAKEIERQKQTPLQRTAPIYDDFEEEPDSEPDAVKAPVTPPPIQTDYYQIEEIKPDELSTDFSLQKAVIWSEILAPPVSLREE